MRIRLVYILLLFLSVIFFECVDQNPYGPEYEYGILTSVRAVNVISVADGCVSFKCDLILPNTCYEFERYEIVDDGFDFRIYQYMTLHRWIGCAEVAIPIETHIEICVPTGGKYKFHFYRSHHYDEPQIDVTLYIPDIE